MSHTLTVKLLNAEGQPLPEARLRTLYASDLHFEPVRRRSRVMPDGAVELQIPGPGTALHAQVRVPDYGDVWVMADRAGRGFGPNDGPVHFVLEAARGGLQAAEETLGSMRGSPEFVAHRDAARDLLGRAEAADGRPDLAMRALSHALWAGEYAVIDRAHQVIDARPRRDDFLFGGNAFRYAGDTAYTRYFREVLNYATLPFYLKALEPEEGKPRYERVDEILAWCEREGITPKGHPLWWGHPAGIPEWLEGATWREARRHCERVVRRSVERYRGRIDIWDVINEAHDWANGLGLSHEQEVEITRIAADTARAANPAATLVVNNCLPFGENAADGVVNNGPVHERVWTPLSYLRAVLDAGVDFDAVGIQLYCPGRDMLSVSRLLDEYAAFGKPIHITELGVRCVRDEECDPEASEQVLRTRAEWHYPWCEKVQAEWMEWFYTLAYARDEVQAITWWDFQDPAFIATSGFLYEDDTPKEIFFRLRALKERLGYPVRSA